MCVDNLDYGKHYQGLEFLALQVLDLVPYSSGGGGDEFDIEESLEEEL